MLRFFYVHLLAARVVLYLITIDFADRKIARLGMAEIPAAHRRRRPHRIVIGELDVGTLLRVEQAPQQALLGIFRARWITRCGADAARRLFDQCLVIVSLVS